MKAGDLVGGRFRIDHKVGSGGMGVVFRATDETTRRPVAVKLFAWRNAIEVQRAHREVSVLAQLRHPAIVGHVADGLTNAGELYLAMEWVDGVTVADRLDTSGMSAREAVQMARAVAEALAVAHAAGVLHRDIKPSNVLLAGGDPRRAKLIDFGVARVLDEVKILTRTGTAIGTPGYMSPEQARGQRELTPAADVFGLGCLLYECLTGKPAFSGTLAAAVMAKILFASPASIDAACPEAPERLIALLDRMLAKDLAVRLPDCAAVVAELDAVGDLPDGPRRSAKSLATVTVAPVIATQVHCIVGAAQGSPDDMLEPPSAEAYEQLIAAADEHGADLQVFATGAVVGHLYGESKETTARAALLALVMQEVLAGWSIVISSVSEDVGKVADAGTQLMTSAAMAAIFRKPPGSAAIVVDPQTAGLLRDDFELAPGVEPRLIGRKAGVIR